MDGIVLIPATIILAVKLGVSVRNILLSRAFLRCTMAKRDREFVLMIPVYREMGTIVKTMRYFSRLDYPLDKLRIHIITTEKERADGKQTTIEVVKKEVVSLNRRLKMRLFYHTHYPYKQGRKSDQLNYCISMIKGNPMIGFYDADSRPDINTLSCVACFDDEVMQQYSIYVKDAGKLGFFSKASALYQSIWTMRYEIPTAVRMYERLNSGKAPTRLVYAIGHGLFVRAKYMRKIGGFPTEYLIEDLPLGMKLTLKGVPIRPLPMLDNVEAAPGFISLYRQSAVWFSAESSVGSVIRKSESKYPWYIQRWLHLIRACMNLQWLIGPLALDILMLYCLLIRGYAESIFMAMAALYIYVPAFLTVGMLKSVSFRDKMVMLTLLPLRMFTHFLGPLIYYFNMACGIDSEYKVNRIK